MQVEPHAVDGAWLARANMPDGRELEYFIAGPEDGMALVCHHGTPMSSFGYVSWIEAAADVGVRIVAYSRPGYGKSTRLIGRDVAQAAQDTASLLDYLGIDAFVSAGWSGGGPHALACGALLPDRCKGVASVAGLGHYGAQDLNYAEGMGDENVEEFDAAVQGDQILKTFIEERYSGLTTVTGPQVAESFGSLISEPDNAALTDELAEQLAVSIRWGLCYGFEGWIDDDLAFVKPWGFGLEEIGVPVTVWQGEQDHMVPSSHGKWLKHHIPGSELLSEPEHGHISLVTTNLPIILEMLLERAG